MTESMGRRMPPWRLLHLRACDREVTVIFGGDAGFVLFFVFFFFFFFCVTFLPTAAGK